MGQWDFDDVEDYQAHWRKHPPDFLLLEEIRQALIAAFRLVEREPSASAEDPAPIESNLPTTMEGLQALADSFNRNAAMRRG